MARNAQILGGQEDTKDVFITTSPEVVWNGAKGLGSRPRGPHWSLSPGLTTSLQLVPRMPDNSICQSSVSWMRSVRGSPSLVT